MKKSIDKSQIKNIMAKSLSFKHFQNKVIKSKKTYDRKKTKNQYEWLKDFALIFSY